MSLLQNATGLVDTVLDRTIAPGYSRVGHAVRSRLPGWPADPPRDALAGREVVVTGASSGLGMQTADELAALGAHVHLVVRDEAKGERVRTDLARDHGEDAFTLWTCDLADLDDVRRLADRLVARGGELAVLVHNAGALPAERTETAQGHELTMALHLLAPVLLTERIVPVLAPQARVLLVTSGGMYAQRLRDDDPEYLRGEYSGTTAYARSKRAQVDLLPVLQERWRRRGLSVYATHPGWADTPGVLTSLPTFHKVTGPFLRDLRQGADTTVWLAATEPAPPPGGLWHDRRERPSALTQRTRSTPEQRARMWRWVEESLGLAAEG
jgi:NAD(P)-dependent dehydrogenase (short-subunit alcohol dehydrogenase family)